MTIQAFLLSLHRLSLHILAIHASNTARVPIEILAGIGGGGDDESDKSKSEVNDEEGNEEVEAMLDKTISALSGVFIGALGSTFTEDILWLRRGWGTTSRCDEYLCEGEVPKLIAGDE
ncbi:O-fucosyltransferase 36-like [Cynara cardunculus var. scolymus]|uniref:O-fucosyltransferase 36-like n=1 Tax=Cynara cardunculus var. scolymus TaxID=59895 RepID=UPI000D62CEB7|nr:O-fucosyltransferase 36-like [Cynara cardunculus var. scolymus]